MRAGRRRPARHRAPLGARPAVHSVRHTTGISCAPNRGPSRGVQTTRSWDPPAETGVNRGERLGSVRQRQDRSRPSTRPAGPASGVSLRGVWRRRQARGQDRQRRSPLAARRSSGRIRGHMNTGDVVEDTATACRTVEPPPACIRSLNGVAWMPEQGASEPHEQAQARPRAGAHPRPKQVRIPDRCRCARALDPVRTPGQGWVRTGAPSRCARGRQRVHRIGCRASAQGVWRPANVPRECCTTGSTPCAVTPLRPPVRSSRHSSRFLLQPTDSALVRRTTKLAELPQTTMQPRIGVAPSPPSTHPGGL